MPNVLILGATGYLGQSISAALLRTGTYHIYGHARTPEKATHLATQEITPLTSPGLTATFLETSIAQHSIDIVVDASAAYEHASLILESVVKAAKARAAALTAATEEGSAAGPKLGFVYTSGSGIYGDLPTGLDTDTGCVKRVSDLSPVGNGLAAAEPTAFSRGWRPRHEQAVLAAREVLDVAIARPHMLYGRGSWVLETFFAPLAKQKAVDAADKDAVVTIPADPTARLGLVHVDGM